MSFVLYLLSLFRPLSYRFLYQFIHRLLKCVMLLIGPSELRDLSGQLWGQHLGPGH